MLRIILAVCAVLAFCVAAGADDVQPRVVQSWHGLSGLFVVPTARVLPKGTLSGGYNESKHVENFGGSRFMDRQIRATFTYAFCDRFEASAVYDSNQYDVGLGFTPPLDNSDLVTFGVKALVFTETARRPAVAIAVRDITDQDRDISPLEDLHPGRQVFALASKRLVTKPDGKYFDGHVGFSSSSQESFAPLFGFELSGTREISLIFEGMYNSPFVNFRDAYVHGSATGTSNHAGRFIHDIGVRWYSDVLPGLVIDTGFIGDGSYEFSFGASYAKKL